MAEPTKPAKAITGPFTWVAPITTTHRCDHDWPPIGVGGAVPTGEVYEPGDENDFDGCSRRCRRAGKHTREPGCEFAPPLGPPTPFVWESFTAEDGFTSWRTKEITWAEAAGMLRPTGDDVYLIAALAWGTALGPMGNALFYVEGMADNLTFRAAVDAVMAYRDAEIAALREFIGARALAALEGECDTAIVERDEARAVLARLVEHDNDPCHYDHNRLCQTHLSSEPCVVAEARKLLGMGTR